MGTRTRQLAGVAPAPGPVEQSHGLTEPPHHPGWYRDPLGPGQLAYWDGTRWTGEKTDAAPATRRLRTWYLVGVVAPYSLSVLLPLVAAWAAGGRWSPAEAERVIAAGWWPWLVGTMATVVLAGVTTEYRHGDTAGAHGWNAAAVTAAVLVGGAGLVASGLIELLMQLGSGVTGTR